MDSDANNLVAESNGYQLTREIANERAVAAGIVSADTVATPDRSSAAFARTRPIKGGQCIGSAGTGYGTLGLPVRVESIEDPPEWMVWGDSVERGDRLVTTNRHVADGQVGEPIYQPGVQADPDSDDRIGEVAGYAKLGWPAAPDIAFIAPDKGVEWGGYLADGMGESVHHGDPADLVGETTRLFGANSGGAEGRITDAPVTVRVNYGGKWGVLEKHGVLRATDNSRGGDSGSPSDSGASSGRIQGWNFASSSGFGDGGTSHKVPVQLVEQAGVRALSNAELGGAASKASLTPQNSIVIRGSGPDAGYQIFLHETDAGDKPRATTVGGASVNAGDSVRRTRKGEPGEWVAEGVVAGGADAWTCWRQVARIESENPDVQFDVLTSKGEWAKDLDPATYGTDPGPRDGPPEGSPTDPGAWTPPAKLLGRRIEERPTWGIVDRHAHTIKARTRTIREGKGAWWGDENSEELGSIQAAANYLPSEVRHAQVIQLTGHHDGEPGDAITFGDHDVAATRSAHVHIQGDPDDRTACVLDAQQINTQFDAGPPRSVGFHDLTIRGCVTAYGGVVGFSNVDLSPGRASEGYPLAGYGGRMLLNDCHVTGESLAKCKNGKRIELVNTTVDVSGALLRSGVGGGKLVVGAGVEIEAERLRPAGNQWQDVSPVEVHDPHGVLDHLR